MAKNTAVKTIAEINERIRAGKAVVLNAEEMTETVRRLGKEKAAAEVDVVTTGTFSPMCSSGLLFNIGQKHPPTMKVSKLWLNDVPAYGGIAAADLFLGATEPSKDDPLNKVYPGRFEYGGGNVIEDLARGKSLHMVAEGYGTDCYPRKELEVDVTLADLPYAELLNPRNCYQNYNAAVNLGDRTIYTYMGPLKPRLGNLNYATAGKLSPLFNDPYFRTIGLGTRIWVAGAKGWVLGAGTQHVPSPKRTERGIPLTPSGTLMIKGDLKQMDPKFLRGLSLIGYGPSLAVGVAIPIPILDADMAWFTGVDDSDILMPVKDYGQDYPNCLPRIIEHLNFEQLRSGQVTVMDTKVETAPLTSYSVSLEAANSLKEMILKGEFELTQPVETVPAG